MTLLQRPRFRTDTVSAIRVFSRFSLGNLVLVSSATLDSRRELIVSSAFDVLREEGIEHFTVAGVAKKSGLSRPAVYQYFDSTSHILTELVLNDMSDLVNELERLLAGLDDPLEQVRVWVHYSVSYLASNHHSVIKTIGRDRIPADQLPVVGAMHGFLMTSLTTPLKELGAGNAESVAAMIYGAVDAAATRITAGASYLLEVQALESFILDRFNGSPSSD